MQFIDQIGHQFTLTETPQRIVSVVPSQTELLYDLGLGDRVVGITKFCIHPNEWFKTKNRVGGTKTVNFEKIAALKPDLIIANKEENTKTEIEALQKLYSVYTSDIYTLDDSFKMIGDIGVLTNTEIQASKIINKIKSDFKSLQPINSLNNKVLYLIWKNPYMSIGANTFINDMINRIGLNHVVIGNRYPELTENAVKNLNPDYIFLSSEPYPFKQKHIEELRSLCPGAKIMLVDGEMFSWYGSRLTKAKDYLVDLIEKLA